MIDLNSLHYLINSVGNKYKACTLSCDICGISKIVPYYSYYKQEVHKCKKCSSIGRNHFNRTGKPPTNAQIKCITNCEYCGEFCKPKTKLSIYKSPKSFCNPSCQIKWQNRNTQFNKGENNPSYKHGERVGGKLAQYGDDFTSELRRLIKIRDGYNCQKCFKNYSGPKSRLLDVHHVDRNKYNNEASNLVCLCKTCHTKTHWEEGK